MTEANRRVRRLTGAHHSVLARLITCYWSLQAAEPTSSYSAMKGHLKSAKIMVLVLGTFYLCWCPYMAIAGIAASYGPQTPVVLQVVYDGSKILAITNSALNPCIYAWRNSEFRKAYKKLLHIC
ncbi:hypothetical protein LSAT2_018281 [Lamellibrachia satsuma]|nr:hypothetical protein LSAT2_018281 [Lamellibrachia satsuma]